jgi:recombination protein RecA
MYGVGTVLTLDNKTTGNYDIYSSGSVGFDYITLGVGGFVKGKLYELMGWEGTGKSTICGHLVAECQKKGGVALYIDGEHALDKTYFQALGVDTTKILVAQPSCGEEGFNVAMEMINSGGIDLVIIDSDSSLIPKKQLDGDVGDSTIGYKARLNSNAYPKLKTALSDNNVCVVVISQYREKIGVMFGNPTTTQGGHALKFYSDIRIEVSKSLAKEGDVTYGNLTKVKATKNKISSPYRQASFEIIYGQGIDKVGEILELINTYEVGRKYGKTMTFEDVKYDLEDFKSMLMDNQEFYDSIKQTILNKIWKTVDTQPVENEQV